MSYSYFDDYDYHQTILRLMLANKATLSAELGKSTITRFAVGATIGGVLAGPVGAGLGGLLGSMTAAFSSSDSEYDALVKKIEELDRENIKKLVLRVRVLVEYSNVYSLDVYLENKGNRQKFMKLVREF